MTSTLRRQPALLRLLSSVQCHKNNLTRRAHSSVWPMGNKSHLRPRKSIFSKVSNGAEYRFPPKQRESRRKGLDQCLIASSWTSCPGSPALPLTRHVEIRHLDTTRSQHLHAKPHARSSMHCTATKTLHANLLKVQSAHRCGLESKKEPRESKQRAGESRREQKRERQTDGAASNR